MRALRNTGIAVALLVLAFAIFELATWPDVAALAKHNPSTTAFVERFRERAKRGTVPLTIPSWSVVPYSRISDELKLAVLVAEDIEFFSHNGFSVAELKLSMTKAWEAGEAPRGASTITQQLAKNLWLSPSRNPWRKAKEALLTRALEKQITKRRILDLYLNVVEFGPGVYGAEAAARRYFGKPAAELTPSEAAELAGGLPKPSKWHPGATSPVYRKRVARILGRMDRAALLRGQL